MNVSVRPSGAWQHTLEIEVPADEVERRLDDTARSIQRRASLPGFRKGKVPLPLVRQHYAEAVEQEFLEEFISRATGEAIDEAHLEPVVPALVCNLHFTPGQPLRFEALVDVRPEVEVKDVRGIGVTRRRRPLDDAAVDAMLQQLREDSSVFVDLDRSAEKGDLVLVDSVRLDANGRRLPSTRARGLRIKLGALDLLPDLENGLLGAAEGQERTLDVAYPAEHQTAQLAGKTVRYLLKVRKIQAQKLRDLDDNFAREVFQLESVQALRDRVRQRLEEEDNLRVRREVEGTITDELIRRNPFDLPPRLIEYTLDRVIREAARERAADEALRAELETRYRPGVERSLKRELLLASLAKQQSLVVTNDEVAEEIDRMAQSEPRQAARVRAHYQSVERRNGLRESLLERKALDWVVSQADIHDEVVTDAPLIVPATR